MNFKLVAIHSPGTEDEIKEEKYAKTDVQRNKVVHNAGHFKL